MANRQLSGYVETEDGDPVEGAIVEAVPHSTGMTRIRETTDANGYYEFNESQFKLGVYEYQIVCRTNEEGVRAKETYPFIEAEQSNELDMEYISEDWTLLTPTPPHVYNGGTHLNIETRLESNEHSDHNALVFDQYGAHNNQNWWYASNDYYIADMDYMYFSTKFDAGGSEHQFRILLDGEIIFAADSQNYGNHDWTDRTHPVRKYNGMVEMQIGHYVTSGSYRDLTSWLTNVKFE